MGSGKSHRWSHGEITAGNSPGQRGHLKCSSIVEDLLATRRALAGHDPESSQAAALQEGGLDTPIHRDHRPGHPNPWGSQARIPPAHRDPRPVVIMDQQPLSFAKIHSGW